MIMRIAFGRKSCFAAIAVFALTMILVNCSENNSENNMDATKMIETADSLFKSRKYEEAKAVYTELSEYALKNELTSELTEGYAMIARSDLIQGRKEEGRAFVKKAEIIASDKFPLGWSRYLGVRGRFEWQDKELGRAKATFIEMYDFCSKQKLYDRAIDAAHMVAIVGTPEEQIEWGKKGIKEAEAGNVTGWLGPLWNNLGATYEDMKDYPNSLTAYQKAREYHHKYSGDLAGAIADWAVAHAFRLNGDYAEAGKWLDGMVARFEALDANEFIGWTHKELAEIEIHKDNKEEALAHLVEAEKRLKAEMMEEWDPEGYKNILDQIEALK